MSSRLGEGDSSSEQMPSRGSETRRGRVGGRPSRRSELLDAAVELFARGGSRGTSLESIARQIGVSRAAITHHFGSKEGLLREVMAISDRMDAAAVDPAEPYTGIEHIGALRSLAPAMVADKRLLNLTKLTLVLTVEAFDLDHTSRQSRVERYEHFRRGTAAIIRRGQDDGTIRHDVDADLVAAEIVAFMDGADLQWYLDSNGVDIVQLYNSYFDRLVADLGP